MAQLAASGKLTLDDIRELEKAVQDTNRRPHTERGRRRK
jgi:F420-dependent methylenetetrahydromethanopterin dehydrogenase